MKFIFEGKDYPLRLLFNLEKFSMRIQFIFTFWLRENRFSCKNLFIIAYHIILNFAIKNM